MAKVKSAELIRAELKLEKLATQHKEAKERVKDLKLKSKVQKPAKKTVTKNPVAKKAGLKETKKTKKAKNT